MKKVSKMKKFIIAAMCAITGLCGAASVAGTYAWFVASNTVSVSGMSIKAQTEDGIVIAPNNYAASATFTASSWKDNATADNTGTDKQFIPTSTKTAAAWYHNNASEVDNHLGTNTYDSITSSVTDVINTHTDGVAVISSPSELNGKNLYLYNRFSVQSSGAALTEEHLYVTNLSMTQENAAHILNRAVRVAFVCNSKITIFAPITSSTDKYFIAKQIPVYSATETYDANDIVYYDGQYYKANTAIATAEAWTAGHWSAPSDSDFDVIAVPANNDKRVIISGSSTSDKLTLGQYTDAGTNKLDVQVFIYFEGEDAACTSANAALGLDTLGLSFKIGNIKDASVDGNYTFNYCKAAA